MRDEVHRFFRVQRKNTLNWERSCHDKQLETLSVHQRDSLKTTISVGFLLFCSLIFSPKALDKVAAKIPAKREKKSRSKEKKSDRTVTRDDWTKGRDHFHRLIVVDETRFTISIIEMQRTIDDLNETSIASFVKIH